MFQFYNCTINCTPSVPSPLGHIRALLPPAKKKNNSLITLNFCFDIFGIIKRWVEWERSKAPIAHFHYSMMPTGSCTVPKCVHLSWSHPLMLFLPAWESWFGQESFFPYLFIKINLLLDSFSSIFFHYFLHHKSKLPRFVF